MPDDIRPPDPAPPARGFTIRDAMILVAAIAVGAFGYRANEAVMTELGFARGGNILPKGWEIHYGPALVALTAALVISRVLPPRPSRSELFRQPGFMAACVTLLLTARCLLKGLLLQRLFPSTSWVEMTEWGEAMHDASVGILATWSSLYLAGCLKAERGWVDRTLRAMAVVWIIAGIASELVPAIDLAWYGFT